jgi:hypothetical protein
MCCVGVTGQKVSDPPLGLFRSIFVADTARLADRFRQRPIPNSFTVRETASREDAGVAHNRPNELCCQTRLPDARFAD